MAVQAVHTVAVHLLHHKLPDLEVRKLGFELAVLVKLQSLLMRVPAKYPSSGRGLAPFVPGAI